MKTYLYLIRNSINGKLYVGISYNIKTRWRDHKKVGRNYPAYKKKGKAFAIHRAIYKHGENNFTIKTIGEYGSYKTACRKEISCIKLLKELKYKLYNETNGGEGHLGPINLTNKERKRRSECMKGKNNYFYGCKLYGKANGHYGHKMKPHVKEILLTHRAKLTLDQVENIRVLYFEGNHTQTELAKMFDISLTQVHCIVRGKKWNNGNPQPKTKPRTSKDTIIKIREKYDSGNYTQAALAKEYGLSAAQIHRIVKRKRWKNI